MGLFLRCLGLCVCTGGYQSADVDGESGCTGKCTKDVHAACEMMKKVCICVMSGLANTMPCRS